jgi:threonine aldolase
MNSLSNKTSKLFNKNFASDLHSLNKFSKINNGLSKKNYNTYTNGQNKININQSEYFKEYIELRSDVKTIPTKRMLENIQNCYYGDDCFNEDPTTNKLLAQLCALFKKESALFVPSGTMGNMACLSLHAQRGDYIIQGLKSHIYKTEFASQMLLGFKPLTTKLLDPINPTAVNLDADHRTNFDVEKFSIKKAIEDSIAESKEKSNSQQRINQTIENIHINLKAIAFENTHNYNGGVLFNMKYFKESILPEKLNNLNKIAFHLDGSRILNAAVAAKAPPASLTVDFETVNICLSKALGAPCGSVIFVENKNYEKAKGIIKALGGGMRQNGVLAAAALIALEDYQDRFEIDHTNAKLLAESLENIKGLSCPLPQSNIVNIYLDKQYFKGVDYTLEFESYLMDKHKVLTHAFENGKYIRCVLHHQVSKEQVYKAIKAIKNAMEYFYKKQCQGF